MCVSQLVEKDHFYKAVLRGSAYEIAFAAQMHENRGRTSVFILSEEKVSVWELSDDSCLIVRTQIIGKTKFSMSQTHILRCASFCARLQLRHICIYERHIGFAYRINRFDICWIRYCRGDVPTFLTNRLIRLPLVE